MWGNTISRLNSLITSISTDLLDFCWIFCVDNLVMTFNHILTLMVYHQNHCFHNKNWFSLVCSVSVCGHNGWDAGLESQTPESLRLWSDTGQCRETAREWSHHTGPLNTSQPLLSLSHWSEQKLLQETTWNYRTKYLQNYVKQIMHSYILHCQW